MIGTCELIFKIFKKQKAFKSALVKHCNLLYKPYHNNIKKYILKTSLKIFLKIFSQKQFPMYVSVAHVISFASNSEQKH